jgi:hypothetical protein
LINDIKDVIVDDENDELAFLSEEDELDKKLNDDDICLTGKDSLIVTSFRLPIQITKVQQGQEFKFVMNESRSHIYPTIFRL